MAEAATCGDQATGRRAWLPALCVVAAAVLWGTIGPSYKIALDHIATDELTIVTIRAGAAAAMLAGWLLWRRPAAFRIAREDIRFFVVYGLLTVTVFYPALIYAYIETSVAEGTVLMYLAPAIVTIGAALFFRERLTRRKLIALVATFAGCCLVVEVERPANLEANALGIGLGLLSAVAYASYSLMGKRLLAIYAPTTMLVYNLLIGGAGLIVVKLVVSPGSWPSLAGVAAIGSYNGIVTTLAPVLLYAWGLRGLPSSEASILATVEPVVAIILAAWLLGESLAAGQLAGACLVLGGVILLASGSAANSPHPALRTTLSQCWERVRKSPPRSELGEGVGGEGGPL